MATIYIDPSSSTNGDGSFATPRNIFPTVLVYGDVVLFKEQTIYNGTWTLPTPSGIGSNTNRVILGTYDAITGLKTNSTPKQATIRSVSITTDAVLISSISYVTISSLHCIGGNNFPYAGIRALSSSYITVEHCTVENVDGIQGAYGIRFDNVTGSGSAQSNWVISYNVVKNIAGNSGIFCIWSATSGEHVTNITIKNNTVSNLRHSAGTNAFGIDVRSRASTHYTDKAGFCGKGVQILNNQIQKVPGYALYVKGVNAATTAQANIISGNIILDTGNGLYDSHCLWLGACYNFIVSSNTITKSTALSGGTTGTGVGIFIDKPTSDLDGCEDILVTRNIVTSTGRGDTTNSEVGGAGIFVLNSRRVTVSYNLVQYCLNGIIVYGGFNDPSKSVNVDVYNNTVAYCDGAGLYICRIADLVKVKNNLLFQNTTGIYTETSGAGTITNYTEQYNLVWKNTEKWTEGNAPTTTAATITTRTPDASNLETDPKINTTFQILPLGAAYHSGTLVYPKQSLTGFSSYPTPSIGAYEYIAPRGVR
jgi:hypothetical protein